MSKRKREPVDFGGNPWGPAAVDYQSFNITDKDGKRLVTIALPSGDLKGKAPEEIRRRALAFYKRTKLAERTLKSDEIHTLMTETEGIAKWAISEVFAHHTAFFLTSVIMGVYAERIQQPDWWDDDTFNRLWRAATGALRQEYAKYPDLHADLHNLVWRDVIANALERAEVEQEYLSNADLSALLDAYIFTDENEVARRFNEALSLHAQDEAQRIANAIDPRKMPLDQLESLIGFQHRSASVELIGRGEITVKGRKQEKTPASPDPFARAIVPFASNPVAYGGMKALFQSRSWPEDESGRPRYVHKVEGKKMRGLFTYHVTLPAASSDEALTLAQKDLAHEILKDMGPDTAWLHMLLLAYSAQTHKGEAFVIPREAVYRVLGLDKRTDLTRNNKDEKSLEEIARLRSIGLQIVRLQLDGKDIQFQHGIGSLWDMSWHEHGQARLMPETVGKWTLHYNDWQLKGRPGLVWADVFLYGDGPRQFGNMAREMLENIDRRKAPLSAGLAVQLIFAARFHPGEAIRVSNRDVIEFVGGDPTPGDFRKRYEVKNQVINAIYEQVKWGWSLDFTEWPDSLRPDLAADRADTMTDGDGSEAAPNSLPAGYWDSFLNATTRFIAPAPILEANVKAKKQLPMPAARRQPAPYTAADFKEDRKRLGWTQKEMAHYLGVSQQMVSYIENGKREMAPAYRRKIEKALCDME